MGNVPSEGISIRLAPAVLNTVPTAEWTQAQIDKGSLQNWKRTPIFVERDIHTPYMVKRQGDVVGWTVQPQIAHDLNKDIADLIAEAAFRCVGQHPGGTGKRKFRPSAVVAGGADAFTVAALGALPAGTIIRTRGFANAANNGTFVTIAGSTATSIKVTVGTLVAEAAPPANATLDVIGFQASVAADVKMDASGNLTSAATNFTQWQIPVGSRLVIGGELAANRFATESNNCLAYVKSAPTATSIPLEYHIHDIGTNWVPAVDAAAGKTIQVFFSSLYRNYSILDTKYAEPLLYGELEEPRAGSDGTARYTDAKYLAINTLTLQAQLRSKITATLAMIGTDADVPKAVAQRTGGVGAVAGDSPAQAYAPLATDLVDGHNDLKLIRLYSTANAKLVGQVNAFTLTIGNNVTAKECLGTPGATGHIFGEFMHSVNVQAYYDDSDQTAAGSDNRKLAFDAFINNAQYGISFRMPRTAMRNDQKTYAANTQVSLTFDAPAFGHEDTNVALECCIFGFVPPLAGPQ